LTALNPGYHRHLRAAARALRDRTGLPRHVIDLACGSGSSTRALVDLIPGVEVLGLDASDGMLEQARAKSWPDGVRFENAVAGELDIDAIGRGGWDAVFTAYLFRNVEESVRDDAVREAFELLRPGGWLVVQEYSVDGDRRATLVWDVVSQAVIIPLATLVDGNRDLYRYLWRSVRDFDATATFMDRLAAAGFADVATRTVGGWQRGILHTFVARKPEGT
ncbi:MAG: class I SAM-dependent methyltransferase, partial [Propionibacterium sp.]|nr:class I SAM-dependent methyltransferase [Propionibacterium sp.]